ncbi:DUF397 domain-containing protein [Nocardia concava]|uniref:DUF397 domain-containing protein n=1 Tax=Nocardia concava TaxID=257281 RepID=UPI0002EB3CB1|nr:DUF397 domain-containing protein [Nocardia concava]
MSTTEFHDDTHNGWFKSSKSNDGPNCVEVKFAGDVVLIRDSKFRRDPINADRAQPMIEVGRRFWNTFLAFALGAEVESLQGLPTITPHASGEVTITARSGDTTLTFTETEWAAFISGVQEGEFIAA